jgi:hypothetical protein
MMSLKSVQPCHKAFQPAQLPSRRRSRQKCAAGKAGKPEKITTELPAQTAILGATGLLTPILLDVQNALAQKGEYGIVEGRIASMTHPILMGFLFGASVYTGWLGFQWRRARTIPEQLKELKAELPAKDSEGNRPAAPQLEREIAELEKTRKELTQGKFKDKHWNWGSLLLGLGVVIGIAGPINTYIRVGKLFPGPHLYAGAGIVALWAVAASLVPAMQKGNEGARTLHITLNCINIGLFAWQIPTGLEIVEKVLQFTTFP